MTDFRRTTWEDYRWLTSGAADSYLAQARESRLSSVALTTQLRKQLTAQRTHLLLEQIELRRRAREKFSSADEMYFTRKGLEQATDEAIGHYKADRFPQSGTVADFCCGIGGDLLTLAGSQHLIGIDRDPALSLLAKANVAAAYGPTRFGEPTGLVEVVAVDLQHFSAKGLAAWHIDPDRRPAGRRTTHVEACDPPPEVLNQLLAQCPHAAIKLAPAADVPAAWSEHAELEWISSRGECRQLVVWRGALAKRSGVRTATRIGGALGKWSVTDSISSISGQVSTRPPFVARPGRYVFEPDPAVIAAHLVGPLAVALDLAAIEPGIAYLTGDIGRLEPIAACFEVLEVLPYDARRVKALLRERGWRCDEIKKRGVELLPENVRKQIAVPGDEPVVLLLMPIAGRVTAILARRIVMPTAAP